MENGLRRRLGPDFDGYCFSMDDRMHDGSRWAKEQRAGPNKTIDGETAVKSEFICRAGPRSSGRGRGFGWRMDCAADSDPTSMDFDDYYFPMDDRLGRRLGPDFDDYCFPMVDRLGRCSRRLGPDFDDYCFRWMIDWAADTDSTSMTTQAVLQWMIGCMMALGRRLGPDFDDYCSPTAPPTRTRLR